MKKALLLTTTASLTYFIIYLGLKYSLQDAMIDWNNAFLGAAAFGLIIFLIHKLFIWTESTV